MSKVKFRLKPHEAIALGFEVRECNGFGNAKYSLDKEQQDALIKIRDFHTLDKDGEVVSDVFETNETTTETNQYSGHKGFTAISSDGGIMDIKKYCEF